MRLDIKEARSTLKVIVNRMGLGSRTEDIYNLAIKTYLKGYYSALKNVELNNAFVEEIGYTEEEN